MIFVATGCLLGTLTVAATVLGSAGPAFAACSSHHTNVEGYDSNNNRYGNYAVIYVNTSSTINNANGPIFRSLFVQGGSFDNDVEVGWTANNGGPSNSRPTVYAEWVNRGVDSLPQFYTGFSLNYDTYYSFMVFNSGHQEIFRFKVGNEVSPFNYSPTMNFDLGRVITNSEHYNSCDSLWTDMQSLSYYNSSGNFINGYGNLACFSNDSVNDWLFNKIDNTELKVDQNVGVTC
jgi:hypothetical protein